MSRPNAPFRALANPVEHQFRDRLGIVIIGSKSGHTRRMHAAP